MGRRKLEIKRIEDKGSRQVTFCKRRNGLMEKARQLSVLCSSSVAIIIVSSTGKVYTSSSGDSMAKILKGYETQHPNDLKTLDLEEKTRNYVSLKELLEIVQCKLEEASVDDLSVDSLTSLEEQLKSALSVTSAKKAELTMKFVKNLQEKEKLLREENKILSSYLTKMEKKMCMETNDDECTSSDNNSVETLRLLK